MLPAPSRSHSNGPLPSQRYEDGTVRQMLVVQQRRATTAPSPVHQVPGLGSPDQRVVEERREGLRVETPASAPTVRLLFRDEKATPAVLQFLRNTKLRRMVIQAPRGGR